MVLILKLYACLVLVDTIYLMGLLLGCRLSKMPIERVRLFMGPRLIRHTFRSGVQFEMGVFPSSVSATITGMDPTADVATGFNAKSPLARASVSLLSVATLIIFGALTIGTQRLIPSLASGFRQLYQGTIAPVSVGQHLMFDFLNYLDRSSLQVCVGLVCIKYAALCLSPIPSQNLFVAISQLLMPPLGMIKQRAWITAVGVCLMLWVFCSWVLATLLALGDFFTLRPMQKDSLVIGAISFSAFVVAVAALDHARPKSNPAEGAVS